MRRLITKWWRDHTLLLGILSLYGFILSMAVLGSVEAGVRTPSPYVGVAQEEPVSIAATHKPHRERHHFGIVVDRHGVVVRSSLKHCKYEDGSGGKLPCTWNIGRKVDGNGEGLAYWISKRGHTHYVWAVDPVRYNVGPPLHWVSSGLADALAEGPNPAWAREWEQCVTRGTTHRLVICPDGYREKS
jgi:hypothetical protein